MSAFLSSPRIPAFLFLIPLLLTALAAGAAEKPNIIIFLADDLGYADIGAGGDSQDILTPHIDAIANSGVRFTDGYATHPVCSPSRAGLMSGMYQHRFGFETNSSCEAYAAPNLGLPRKIPTLARKQAGLKPKLFFLSENQIACAAVRDIKLFVPTDITTSQYGSSGLVIEREDPLFTPWVFKVPDVVVACLSINDRRITGCRNVMIADL